MFGLKIISISEYNFLLECVKKANLRVAGERARAQDRISQFERLFIAERERADRLMDQVVTMSGNEPISPQYAEEKKAAIAEAKSHEQELLEIYNEQLAEIFPNGVPETVKEISPRDPITNLRPEDVVIEEAKTKVESPSHNARS